MPEAEDVGEDLEPLQAPRHGWPRTRLQRAVFERLLAGEAAEAIAAPLRARGLLPAGPAVRRALDALVAEVAPYADAFARWRGADTATQLPLEVEIDGLRLHGRIDEVYADRVARLRIGAPNGPSAIRHGLDWLLLRAADHDLPFDEFHETPDAGVGPFRRDPLGRDDAIAALRTLLALRRDGLRQPLPFAPRSGWELFVADSAARGVAKAADKWRGRGDGGWAEGADDALRLALRGRDPFDDAAELREFARISGLVFGAVQRGQPQPIALGEVGLPDDDAGDAE